MERQCCCKFSSFVQHISFNSTTYGYTRIIYRVPICYLIYLRLKNPPSHSPPGFQRFIVRGHQCSLHPLSYTSNTVGKRKEVVVAAHPHRMHDANKRVLWWLAHHIKHIPEKVVVGNHSQTQGTIELSWRGASHPHRTGDMNERWYQHWPTLIEHKMRTGGGASHPHRT